MKNYQKCLLMVSVIFFWGGIMKKTIPLLIVIMFMLGCSNQPPSPLDPNDPASYKENKMLIQYLEKEGFSIAIPASEAVNKYNFNNINSLQNLLVGSDRNYRTPEQTVQKIGKGNCTLYNRMIVDYWDYTPTNTGFYRGTIKNGVLKHLEKCICIGKLVERDSLMNIEDEFVAKYGTDGLILFYNKESKNYSYNHPPTYHINFHNRCVTFTFSANTYNAHHGGALKKTILIGKLEDHDLLEMLNDLQGNINKNSNATKELKNSF